MEEKLKTLLKRLLESDNVRVLSVGSGEHDTSDGDCNVERELDELRKSLAELPEVSETSRVIAFGIEFFSDFVRTVGKEGQVKTLEVQLFLAKKPDDVDFDSPEFDHDRLHLDHKRLLAQRMTREAELLTRFLAIVRGALTDATGSNNA